MIVIGESELVQKVLIKDHANYQTLTLEKSGNKIESKILLNLIGTEWKRVRTIQATTFTTQKLKLVFELMKTCKNSSFDELHKISDTTKKFDPKVFWGQYLADIIAKCCFAIDLNIFENPDHIFITHCDSVWRLKVLKLICYLLLPQKLLKYYKVPFFEQESLSFFSQLVKHVLKSRKEDPSLKGNDFIQLLADSQYDEMVDNKDDHRKKLSENEVIASAVGLIIAGYETSSSLISFASYELAKNNEIQERLFEELNEANIDDYQQLMELPYLNAVYKESLRLYPPMYILIRRSSKCKLGESISLDDRTIVGIPIYSIHRDPNNFENPDTFDPDRFMPPRVDQIKPYTYLPYGGGPRICVGMRFAQLTAKLALATFIKNFKTYAINETPPQPVFNKMSYTLNAKPFSIGLSCRG